MTTTSALSPRQSGQLATAGSPAPMVRLDPYAAGGIAAQTGRIAPLAVVSLGFRQEPRTKGELGLPRATKREDENWLHLHDPDGRAPGLKAALEAGKFRRLQIAFPMDRGFIQQCFTRWSASALEIYGDAAGLNVIDGRDSNNPVHRFISADQPDFARLVKTCKAETRIYFALAHWLPGFGPEGEPQSEVLFPDGFGFYAFRTAGRHTAAEIMGYLESISGFTNGRIAGIPFDLEVVFREVVGPDGKKRTVPIANIVVRPPEHIKLNSRTFRQLATAGLEEGRNLQLPALPSPEEMALEGPPDVEDIPPEAMERLAAGDFASDYAQVVRAWHGIVRGTALEADDARADWLAAWSKGRFASLTAVKALTNAEATQLLADVAEATAADRQEQLAARYMEIFGADEQHTSFDQPGSAGPVHPADVQKRVEDDPPPSSSARPASDDRGDLWAENRSLVARATELGLTGVPTLNTRASTDVLRDANTTLAERIWNLELDQRLQAQEEQERSGERLL